MPEQQILWTALPRRAEQTTLEIDVLVSPRLGVDAPPASERQLSDFAGLTHWTRTLSDHLTFEVELEDGTRHDAVVLPVATLDHVVWDHLFPATTFVRPWSFQDLSTRPLYSYSTRYVTAYLKDLYVDIGRRFPTQPPQRGELDPFRRAVGPVTDVRVEKERRPPPREERDIPLPHVDVPPDTSAAPQGCLAWFFRFLRWLLDLLLGVSRWLPARVRYALRTLDKALSDQQKPMGPPPDPTRPKVTMPRTVYPSPYTEKPPIGPPPPGPLEALEQRMSAELALAPVPDAHRDVTFEFARAKRFHERPESVVPPAAPVGKPRLDFHQAVAALGDYPELMRRLGLVVRLRFPRPATATGSVRVIPRWDATTRASDIAPRTAYELAGNRFTAAEPSGSDITGGGLDLDGVGDGLPNDGGGGFDIVQVDTDGAAMKAILAAATLERAHQLDTLDVHSLHRPKRETLPALRSGGLALVRADRGWHVHGHHVDAADLADPVPAAAPDEPAELAASLTAEHLVRGYRVEIQDGAGPWRSLCERVGTYELTDHVNAHGHADPHRLEIADSGYVKRTSATSAPGNAPPLYVSEVLARWTGWSLVAPRPGSTIGTHVPTNPHDVTTPVQTDAQADFRLRTEFHAAPGTLPRLRFGHTYALRIVCVDLCGKRLSSLEPAASQPVTYRRYEPAGPPALLALRRFRPGESLERVVLRSDDGVDNATYDRDVMEMKATTASAVRTRHLFPPKTSQDMAERHGELEAAFRTATGAAGHPDTGYRLSLRESGSFARRRFIDVATVDVDDPHRTLPFGNPKNLGDYWVNRVDATLPTPYLPDPVVAGTALRGLPGLVDHVDGDPLVVRHVRQGDDPMATWPLLQVPYAGAWPDRTGFRIRVAERTPAHVRPTWDRAERLLTLFLPPGEKFAVLYNSYLFPAALEAHGVWDWLDDRDPATGLRDAAEAGAHWMITPSRTLVLVHAVQHPVSAAHLQPGFTAQRTRLGQTDAVLGGTLELHVPSTGRVEVLAQWTDYADETAAGPTTSKRNSVAAVYDVGSQPEWMPSMAFPPASAALKSQEFGDTRHRRVTYRIRATTAYREYLPETVRLDPDPETLSVITPYPQVVEVSVPSSARPPAPVVQLTVPTFGWPAASPAPGWATYEQPRLGGGLRVHLDRPWYLSGEGELLGVVLQAETPLDPKLCSRYGLDAAWAGQPNPEAVLLEPHHFTNSVAQSAVTLAEGGNAIAVGFTPEWDAVRSHWFCDVALDVEALPWNYWPFVRLAFVRFQPQSLPDAMVSAVALGEFVRVAPDRDLRMAWQGDKQHLQVTLVGRAPEGRHPPSVALRVQQTPVPLGSTPDELDWVHVSGDPETIDDTAFFTLLGPVDPGALDGVMRWETVVTLPTDRDSARMRLEVAEYELLRSDEEFGRGLPRVTYAAHVDLT